jgi:hypothetical protein
MMPNPMNPIFMPNLLDHKKNRMNTNGTNGRIARMTEKQAIYS